MRLNYKVEDIHTIPLSTVAERLDLQIQNKGSYYTAICPLHDDKRDSLAIYDNLKKENTKGYWSCFACGISGDSIQLVSDALNLSFTEAVNWIGDTFNLAKLELTEEQRKKMGYIGVMQTTLAKTEDWCRENLSKNGAVLDYLFQTRDLNSDTLDKFGIGYIPPTIVAIKKFLRSLGQINQTLEKAGLVNIKDSVVKPVFYDRVMIPLRNPQGKTIGFVGRAFGKSDIKYLTKNSATFNKADYVYGIHENRDRKPETVLVVEGTFDVMRVYQETELSAVSMLGTAISEEKIREVLKYLKPKRIIFALDGDTAGRKGVKKFIENVFNSDTFRLNMATDFYVYDVPDGYDIDRLIQEDKDEFYKRLKTVKPVVEHFLDYKVDEYDLNDIPSRGRYITEALGIIATINNFSEEDYLKALSKKTGVSLEDLRGKLIGMKVNVMHNNAEFYEKGLLGYVIGNPDRTQQLEESMGFGIRDFLSDDGTRVFDKDFTNMSSKIMYMSIMEQHCIPFKDAVAFGQWLAVFKLYRMLRDYNELSQVSKNILSQKTNGHMDSVSSQFQQLISERMREK